MNLGQPAMIRGYRAIAAVRLGAPVWVQTLSGRWVPGDDYTYQRAVRVQPQDTHCYGVLLKDFEAIQERIGA